MTPRNSGKHRIVSLNFLNKQEDFASFYPFIGHPNFRSSFGGTGKGGVSPYVILYKDRRLFIYLFIYL